MNSVVQSIDESWSELVALVDSLGANGLTVVGADGWAVKDHLIHIAAWEQSVIALLQGGDRWAAMGVERDLQGVDAINDALWAMHRAMTPEQALDYSRKTHTLLMNVLRALSDGDLKQSYNHYQPHDPRDASDDRPALDWVTGNTFEHYAEHIGWIRQLVKESSAAR